MTVLRSAGQVFCRLSLYGDLSHVFHMIGPGLWDLGRKTVKCHFYHIMTYHCCCWPWSRVCRVSQCQVILVTLSHCKVSPWPWVAVSLEEKRSTLTPVSLPLALHCQWVWWDPLDSIYSLQQERMTWEDNVNKLVRKPELGSVSRLGNSFVLITNMLKDSLGFFEDEIERALQVLF